MKNNKSKCGGINIWTAVIFLVALAIYISAAAPVFVFDDNSEFIAAGHRLGITHAPGYPLFSLSAKLFSFLAPSSVYFGINMISVFAGAGVAALAFRLLFMMTGWWAPSVLGAMTIMVSRTFWSQTGQAEVYSLNMLFVLMILNIFWEMRGGREDSSRIVAAAFVFLIALINHYTITLIALICIPYVLWLNRQHLRMLFLLIAPVLFVSIAACSLWMYLPLRSADRPLIQWRDQSEVKGFVKHIYGVDRRTDAPPSTWEEKKKHVRFYVQLLSAQWTSWLLLLAPLGLAGALVRHRGRGLLLLLLWAVLFSGFIFLLNYLFGPRARYVVSVFHITSMCLVAVFIGMGSGVLLDGVRNRRLPWIPVFAVILAMLSWSGLKNMEFTDISRNMLASNYARNLLLTVGRDGVIFSHLETESFPIASLRAVSGKRKDIMLIGNQGDGIGSIYTVNRHGFHSMNPDGISDIESFVLKHSRHARPVYFTFRRKINDMPGVSLHSNGLLYQVNPELEKLARMNPWDRIDLKGIDIEYGGYDYITKNVISKYYVRRAERMLAEGKGLEAKRLFDEILTLNPESRFLHADIAGIYTAIGQFEMARKEYEMALYVDSENVEMSLDTVAIYNNLSFVYGRLGEMDKALKMIEKTVELAPDSQIFLINLGQTYWELDRCPDAIETLERAVELGQRSASVHNILGICYEKINIFPKAEENYEKAIDTEPEMPLSYRDYGIYNAYEAGKPKKAIELLNKYLELEPEPEDKGELMVNLGFLNQQVEDHDEAIIRFKSAIVVGAADTPRRMAIIMGALARSCEKAGRLKDAADSYEQGLGAASAYPSLYRDYASFLMRTNTDIQRAYELFNNYLAAVPGADDHDSIENMKGRILEELKKRK